MFRRYLVLTGLTIFILGFAARVSAENHPTEITALRTENTRHYNLGNGTIRAVTQLDTATVRAVKEDISGSFAAVEGTSDYTPHDRACVGHFVLSTGERSYRRTYVNMRVPQLPDGVENITYAEFRAKPDGSIKVADVIPDPNFEDPNFHPELGIGSANLAVNVYPVTEVSWLGALVQDHSLSDWPTMGAALTPTVETDENNDGVPDGFLDQLTKLNPRGGWATGWDATEYIQNRYAGIGAHEGFAIVAQSEGFYDYDDEDYPQAWPPTFVCFPEYSEDVVDIFGDAGFTLVVEYSVPTLTDSATRNVIKQSDFIGGGHKYNIAPSSGWQMVAAFGDNSFGDRPIVLPNLFDTTIETYSPVIASSQIGDQYPEYFVAQTNRDLTLEIPAADESGGDYYLQRVEATALSPMPAPGTGMTLTLDSDSLLATARTLNLPADTTVEVVANVGDGSISAELFPPYEDIAERSQGIKLTRGSNNGSGHFNEYEAEFVVTDDTAGEWLLALATPGYSYDVLNSVTVTICQNDAAIIRYPLGGECLEIRQPDGSNTHIWNNIEIFSPAGFDGNCNNSCETHEYLATGEPVMPMMRHRTKSGSRWVALKGGTLTINNRGGGLLTTSADTRLVLVDFATTPPTTLPVLRGSFEVSASGSVEPINGISPSLLVNSPMHFADDADGVGSANGWSYRISLANGTLNAAGPLVREVQPQLTAATANTFTFDAGWSIAAAGADSLVGLAELIDVTPNIMPYSTLSISPGDDVNAGLLLPAVQSVREPSSLPEFEQVAVNGFVMQQPASLGGARKAISLAIYPPNIKSERAMTTTDGIRIDENNLTCGDSCLYLRGAEDSIQFDMPDLIVSDTARTAMLNGRALYGRDFSSSFSFEAFDATIWAGQGQCSGSRDIDNPDATPLKIGEETLVIRGSGFITLPGVGTGAETGGGPQIAVSFELCETSLREVALTLSSDEIAVPLGASGVFMSEIGGVVSITPGETTIIFHTKMRASAPTRAGSIVFGNGHILISSLGYVNLRANGNIQLTDFMSYNTYGNLGIGWSPLDLSFEVASCLAVAGAHEFVSYQPQSQPIGDNPACSGNELIYGMLRAGLWRGCGFNNRYPHLACDERIHFVGEYEASMTLAKGMVVDTRLFDLPPRDFPISSLQLAVGEFCSNGPCSQYERGMLGAPGVFGFDVGIYLNLTSNASDFFSSLNFFLGNVDYCLIDEIGPGQQCSAPVRSAQSAARDGTTTVQHTLPLGAGATSAMFGIGYDPAFAGGRPPTLTLFEPFPSNRTIVINTIRPDLTTTIEGEMMMYAIENPLAGDWVIQVNNADSADYQILYAANSTPTFNLTAEPNDSVSHITDICWTSNLPANHTMRLNLYFKHRSQTSDTARGSIVEHLEFAPNNECYEWDMREMGMLGTGTASDIKVYAVLENSAGIVINDDCNGAAYSADPTTTCSTLFHSELPLAGGVIEAPGYVVYMDDEAPPAPTLLSVMGDDDAVRVRFEQPQATAAYTGADLAGFVVTCTQPSLTRVKGIRPNYDLNTSLWESVTLHGFDAGEQATCSVVAVDASGNTGPASASQTATPDGTPLVLPATPASVSAQTNGSGVTVTLPPVPPSHLGHLLYVDEIEQSGGRRAAQSGSSATPIFVGMDSLHMISGYEIGQQLRLQIKLVDNDYNVSDFSAERIVIVGVPTTIQLRNADTALPAQSLVVVSLTLAGCLTLITTLKRRNSL